MIRFLLLFLCVSSVFAQEIDADLLAIKTRMDAIEAFTVDIELDVDVSFINMPTKHAKMIYAKDKRAEFESDDFVMIPKRGLDFSLQQLFEYPFITVNRGEETKNGITYKLINVIPTDKRADFSIATLYLDTKRVRIAESEINTKKNGTYNLMFHFEDEQKLLPEQVDVSFEIERVKIPLNYMGKDTSIDRKQMKEDGMKTGKITLKMTNYNLQSL
ncbi:conserved hypothetical protein [Formosa agariphila KMM 3901]|uniref:Uncharacterized protein n=1 Tax=Formosa agariphila (strain DSM 15362 / KCTC 12365 / LMG 23005 / KMM 3901 / M-2Alg 35-1) TaxID=1347342 RepID=T2KIR1_FORAG|nr:hypothetical protein [Formosa agariphila]CDF78777.1 conserved hypothetical protein [Formosa agariphila KMM 3901]